MPGQVYLIQSKSVTFIKTINYKWAEVGFSLKFSPKPEDIVPYYGENHSCEENAKLVQHLKYLLQDSEKNKVTASVDISGVVKYYKPDFPVRPNQNGNQTLVANAFEVTIKGTLPPLLHNMLQKEENSNEADVKFLVRIENLFLGRENHTIADGRFDVAKFQVGQFIGSKAFYRNAETWDVLHDNDNQQERGPNVSLVVCMDLSERMAQMLPIVCSTGKSYKLTPAQNEVAAKRRRKVEKVQKTVAVLIGQTGKEFPVYKKYLIDGSAVFKAMFENENFEEGKSNRVKLDDLGDLEIECLIQYLYYFDMNACMEDIGIAIKMLEIADRFQVEALKVSLEYMLLRKPYRQFTVGQVLQLFAFTKKLEHFESLKLRVFTILHHFQDKLMESQEFQMYMQDSDLAMENFRSAIGIGIFHKELMYS